MTLLCLDPTINLISTNKTISVLDATTVLTRKGKQIKILSKTPSTLDCFKISPFRCKEFLLPKNCFLLAKSSGFKEYQYGTICFATHEMFLKKWIRSRLKLYREPILLKEQSLEISPYIIGYWAFRGNRTFFNCKHEEVLSRIEQECSLTEGLKVDIVNYKFEKQIYNYRFSREFYAFLKDKNLDKSSPDIPVEYLFSSVKQRLECLTGILDAVGYVGSHSNTFDITVRNDNHTSSIVWLARSLGFYVNVRDTNQLNCGKKKSNRSFIGCVVKRIFVTVDPTLINCASPTKKLNTKAIEASYVCGFDVEDAGQKEILLVETEEIDEDDCLQTDESICILPKLIENQKP